MKPDLHTHTTSSDGLLTPAELVALADKHRVTLLAVTDHDTFDGAAQLLGKPAPMPILQGVELSLRDMPGLHLLGYGRGTDTPLHRKVRALSQMPSRWRSSAPIFSSSIGCARTGTNPLSCISGSASAMLKRSPAT